MSVESRPLVNGQAQAAPAHRSFGGGDWTLGLAKVGVFLALLPFGAIFWAVNGGFSVLGLGVIAAAFNSSGALAWAAISSVTFTVPITIPGLPTVQPLFPWGAVLGATILQIIVIWRRLRHKSIPAWLLMFAVLLSLYDFATTFFGLGTVRWIVGAGAIVQFVLAFLLTFSLEATIGFLLRR
jgi:hypothetical protein